MIRTVFDIEANGLYLDATEIWCICIKHNDDPVQEFDWDHVQQNKDLIIQELDKADELIGHYILNYDLPMLKKYFNWEPRKNVKKTDTLVKSRLLNPDRRKPSNYAGKGGPHSLEAWGYRVGRGKVDNSLWDVYSPTILRRCREDVEINYLTDLSLSTEAIGHKWDEALELEYRFQEIITVQEHNGVYIDQKLLKELHQLFDEKIEEIDNELVPKLPVDVEQVGSTINNPFTIKGVLKKVVENWYPDLEIRPNVSGPFCKVKLTPFSLSKIGKVKEYLLDNGWKPTEWNYSKTTQERTSPKLTEDSFESISGEMPRLVKERILLNQRRSTVQGWTGRLRGDGRLTAGVNSCGTNTGRVRHIGVANIPRLSTKFGKEMRSVFCASPGYSFIGYDAKGLELRMLAHYMDDPLFTLEILNGDIHTYNQEAAGLPSRDDAKTFIYAFLYGAGNEKIGSIIGGTSADGGRIKKKFLDSLPSLSKLIPRVKRASKKGWLRGLDNRRIWMRRDDEGKVIDHKALNTLLQSAGAVVMKRSAVILDSLVDHSKCRKVIDYHDEAQWEVLPEYVVTFCELAEACVVQAGEYFNLNIPLAAESKVGLNWSMTH